MSLRFFVLLLILSFCAGNASPANLYIYYPTTVNPKMLEKQLSASCAKINIMVFGKYKDFVDMVESEKPEGIIVNTLLLQELPDYTIKKQGERNGKTTDEYILLSIDGETAYDNAVSETFGTVNFMSKKNMEKFVESFFHATPQIKLVPKIEDLLTVLNFRAVSAVLIPLEYVNYFKSMSRLSLKETRLLGKSIERISVATRKGSADADIVSALQKFPPEIKAIFGVDTWK